MKHLLLLIICTVMSVASFGQSGYISYTPADDEGRIADLNGAGGILILSKRNDLVVTVLNARRPVVTPKGMRGDGLYEYEVVVSRDETSEPKIEINRRGDVNRVDFVVKTKPDFFRAFIIDEVAKPISMEDLTDRTSAILDANLAQVEFSTTIDDLKVDCPELLARGATLKTEQKATDKSIFITTLTIPIKILDEARDRLQAATEAREALHKKLVSASENNKKTSDKEWEHLDQLEEVEREAADDMAKLMRVVVYATGTNQLPVDISGLRPRSKLVYGVLVRTVVVRDIVTEYGANIEEGGRQFGLREYTNAKKMFEAALNAKDLPSDLRATVQANIAQCDTCILYERYTMGALSKMKQSTSQADVVRYASAAIEFLGTLNMYNPHDFYASRITKLEKVVEDQPLTIKFTLVRWLQGYEGFHEGSVIPNVEVWAYSGSQTPAPDTFRTEKRFSKLVKSGGFVHMGESDGNGELELQLNRKALPSGLFFRPIGYHDNIQIKYMDIHNILQQSEGTYDKRQFRLKMFTEGNLKGEK